MFLTPSDQERLLLSVAGMVARDRRARGVALNVPEATALLSCWVLERARDGDASVQDLMADGRTVLSRDEVMPGVPELLDEVQAEATFPDGRKLVTFTSPSRDSRRDQGRAGRARPPPRARAPHAAGAQHRDRPVQVGSHFHFADVNAALDFDRDTARGFRLDMLAGTSVRFEPGAAADVPLVALGGAAQVPGLQVRG